MGLEMNDLNNLLAGISPENLEKLKTLSMIFGNGQTAKLKEKTILEGITEYEDYTSYKLETKSVQLIKTANRRMLHCLPGNRVLHSLTKKDAEKLFRENSKTAPRGAYNYNRCYHAMFNQFKEWDYITENPFPFKRPKIQREEPVSIPGEEIKLICNSLKEMKKNIAAEMVVFAVETGLRLGEQINLRWIDVDHKNKTLTIGNKYFKTKTKKIRKIPFNKRVEEILNKAVERQLKNGKILREFVFTQNNGKPWMGDTISKAFKKACRENKLPEEYHWHSLRSTAASNWVNRRVPIYTVQKLLGHSRVTTTQIYAKVDMEELRSAVEKL